ncbi:TonB-dependent receptor [Sphingosinicella soli]|uniref:Iron complex outermembrane receptor protein n=1 Tax=Sphingosinicella soli TaxID=333708 RepID=A0A7W7B2D5_9SPHN|nr:TonB-dependent receptor [Sphingosinicella soli]MBB4632594.1 iron complex outermembrane receptor protein [Sphingosinicella soli]
MAICRFMHVVSCLALTAGSGAALAQEQTPSSTQGLEEIVVTAQRVAQNLQDVPIAISAFSASQLRDARIESVRDLAQYTPGLTSSEVNPGEPNFAIRGIGTEGINSNAGGDASVVMFVDGVYIGRGGGSNLNLYDLERVEVLRGPQGTLFGKNVVGGAISLVSRKPDFKENFVGGTVSYGNYDRLELLGRFNYGLSDIAAVSGAFTRIRRDGYTRNATTGNRVDDEDLWGGRLSVRLAPSDVVDIVLSGDYTKQDTLGQPRDNVCNASFNGGVHCVGVDPDPRVVNAVDDGFLKREVGGLSATVTLDSPMGEITSITAWRKADYSHRDAFFSNPVNPPTQIESINENVEESQQFSQELRLAFKTFNNRLSGVMGLYFLTENIERNEMLEQTFPAPAQQGRNAFPQDVDSDSFALFGQANLAVTDRLTLTVGARMTWESKRAHLQGILVEGPGLPPPLSVPFDVRARESWRAFTPRFAADYKVSDNVMIYASAARGFKSGGFQGTAGTGSSAATPYDPEFAWNYEAGFKSRFFDNRVQLNVAAFRTDYTDLQVSQLVPLCCVVIGNAATAKIEGVEAEFVAQLFEGFRIDASYSRLDAKFDSFADGATADFTGNRLPRAPKHQIGLAGQYEVPVTDSINLFGRVGWSYRSKIFFEASNTPLEVQKSYGMLDGRLAVRSADDRWEVAVWGMNLTDKLVKNHIVAFAPFQQQLNTYQPPRTYGATVSFQF